MINSYAYVTVTYATVARTGRSEVLTCVTETAGIPSRESRKHKVSPTGRAKQAHAAKSKPWRRLDRLEFINSDPGLLRLFLRFLKVSGRARETLNYRVHIHETADAAAAQWWADQLDLPRELFQRPTMKKHKPSTRRVNAGTDYHGCLTIGVPKSRELYRRVEGVMASLTDLG
jgi:hypothetical protein